MQRVDGTIVYQNQYQQTGQNVQGTGVSGSSSVRQEALQMAKGTVFEGVITEVKDGGVQISLNNGQSMRAQLEAGVNVRVGEPVLFEVKSNQGGQIMLRQVPVQSALNPTLQKALTAAGLPLTRQNLNMVDIMMRSQMPISRESLNAMVRQMHRFPESSAETLIQMQKLGFPINKESLGQFEAYKAGEHALVERFSQIMDQLPELPGQAGNDAGKMIEIQNQILNILEAGQEENQVEQTLQEVGDMQQETVGAAEQNGQMAGDGGSVVEGKLLAAESGVSSSESGISAAGDGTLAAEGSTLAAADEARSAESSGAVVGSGGQEAAEAAQEASGRQTVADLFREEEVTSLSQQLKQIPGMAEDGRLFVNDSLNTNLSAKELLLAIQQNLQQGEKPTASLLKELFGGKEYKSLLKQVMEEQWLLEPRQVEAKENVEKLYERMNRQMEKLEQFLQNEGKEATPLSRQTTQVRGNLEMMNQINQMYNYIQIPLKLQNQNAHSDLYVYTNKKKLLDKEGELSALLHLELENLGTTDVQIKMLQNHVTTNFYLSEEASFRLVEQHIDSLQSRLEEKGYQCNIHLENKKKETDFVQDFLEQEKPVGSLQRYSFDVLT